MEPIVILISFAILLLTHTVVSNLGIFLPVWRLHIWMLYLWGLNIWEKGEDFWQKYLGSFRWMLIIKFSFETNNYFHADWASIDAVLAGFIIILCGHDSDFKVITSCTIDDTTILYLAPHYAQEFQLISFLSYTCYFG